MTDTLVSARNGILGLMMFAFWAGVLVIVWGVRNTATAGRRAHNAGNLILDERLARGDIDREHYEDGCRVLESHR